MATTYFEYGVMTQKGISIEFVDKNLRKDTSQENATIRFYFPDRPVDVERDYNNPRFKSYKLSDAEAAQLKLYPDIKIVEKIILVEPEIALQQDGYYIGTGYNGYSSNLWFNNISATGLFLEDSAPLNWGLKYHTKYKDKVDWEDLWSFNGVGDVYGPDTGSYKTGPDRISSYNYSLDGTGVDIVIVDAGVWGSRNHPELLDDQGQTRVKYYDWYQHIPGRTLGSNFYNPYFYHSSHGLSVASVAAGRLAGWAKNAHIYDFRIIGSIADGGYLETDPSVAHYGNSIEALECIRHFHVSKSVDPNTGYKRPTVINLSIGLYLTPVGSNGGFDTILPPDIETKIDQIYYKGNSLGLTGENNTFDETHNMRYIYSSSNAYHSTRFPIPFSEIEMELMDQLTEENVFAVKAAGNFSVILSRDYYENNPQYFSEIYNSYITRTYPITILNTAFYTGEEAEALGIYINAGDPIYSNRADWAGEGTIIVGALSPEATIPSPPIDDETNPYYGIIPYNIYGDSPKHGSGNLNFSDLQLSPYTHVWAPSLMWTKETAYPFHNIKLGTGGDNTFPGWGTLQEKGLSTVAYFSSVGPAVDTFAAGQSIMLACDPNIGLPSGTRIIPKHSVNYSLYNLNYEGSNYVMGSLSGTSFAAPQVSGMAALYLQMNPQATPQQFKDFIKEHQTLKIFTEDPLNRSDYTGSIHKNNIRNLSKWGIGTNRGTGQISLNGAPTYSIHWPYALANPLKMT